MNRAIGYDEMHQWPTAINLVVRSTPFLGAVPLGIDTISEVRCSQVPMVQVWYCSPYRVRGLWCYHREHHYPLKRTLDDQWFFLGYRCTECSQVILVTDRVGDLAALHHAMRHECTEDFAFPCLPVKTE